MEKWIENIKPFENIKKIKNIKYIYIYIYNSTIVKKNIYVYK